ncbi:MAG: GNAT family N-acetyltransferase [Mitsuaria chitosanitabida]|uniref:GNAT family N-acetyltransferase n=1 Tax=Roseateles chitosanitabidus TaxID=65048 RepID=UPI001B0104FB|nr:GNAT family N-acetyltransferase [Roseateles chitosanitabidus]MBO9687608.1 GNAT family N-acetyltransferase [Roseateles chitosanitabidus]
MPETFIQTSPADPRAQPLIAALAVEYQTRYEDLYRIDGESAEIELKRYAPALFTPAGGGQFLLLLRDGEAIAGGAFKRHPDPRTAEFKRIWTDRRFRRQGLAGRVLAELEAHAVRQGYERIFLTTGCRQPEAVGLYLRHGYTPRFDLDGDHEALRTLPFDKLLQPRHAAPAGPEPISAASPATSSLPQSAASSAATSLHLSPAHSHPA